MWKEVDGPKSSIIHAIDKNFAAKREKSDERKGGGLRKSDIIYSCMTIFMFLSKSLLLLLREIYKHIETATFD